MAQAIDPGWGAYARMVVEIERSGEPIVVHAAPLGEVGPWPWPFPEPLHILTAWNPGASRPGAVVNRREQARLEEEVGPQATAMWAARGVDPVTGEHDDGVAVAGLSEDTARGLGARYGQDAIFAWSPLEWAIVGCTGVRRDVAGWALGPLP